MCYSTNCRCRNFNSMREHRIKHLWEQHKRFEGTPLGEAFYVAYKRATGYRV